MVGPMVYKSQHAIAGDGSTERGDAAAEAFLAIPSLPPPVAAPAIAVAPWQPPFHLRYRLATMAGAVLSLVWLYVAGVYLFGQDALVDLGALLPHEIGGMAGETFEPFEFVGEFRPRRGVAVRQIERRDSKVSDPRLDVTAV